MNNEQQQVQHERMTELLDVIGTDIRTSLAAEADEPLVFLGSEFDLAICGALATSPVRVVYNVVAMRDVLFARGMGEEEAVACIEHTINKAIAELKASAPFFMRPPILTEKSTEAWARVAAMREEGCHCGRCDGQVEDEWPDDLEVQ